MTQKHHVQQALESAIHIADQVVANSIPSQLSERCHLLEIYAGDHSPLTEAVRSRGLPEHIFVAPECGPWGGWNRLNAKKSIKLWDQISSQQDRERTHVKLCSQLCQYQTT